MRRGGAWAGGRDALLEVAERLVVAGCWVLVAACPLLAPGASEGNTCRRLDSLAAHRLVHVDAQGFRRLRIAGLALLAASCRSRRAIGRVGRRVQLLTDFWCLLARATLGRPSPAEPSPLTISCERLSSPRSTSTSPPPCTHHGESKHRLRRHPLRRRGGSL